MCFRLQSGKKVGTGNGQKYFYFYFGDIWCNIRKLLIKKQTDTE